MKIRKATQDVIHLVKTLAFISSIKSHKFSNMAVNSAIIIFIVYSLNISQQLDNFTI